MLDGFPAETPAARIRKEAPQLEGFAPEAVGAVKLVPKADRRRVRLVPKADRRARPRALSYYPVPPRPRTRAGLLSWSSAAILIICVGAGVVARWGRSPNASQPISAVSEPVASPVSAHRTDITLPSDISLPAEHAFVLPRPAVPQTAKAIQSAGPATARVERPERRTTARVNTRRVTSVSSPPPPRQAPLLTARALPVPLPPAPVSTAGIREALLPAASLDAPDAVTALHVLPNEEPAIREVISRYQSAYQRLDASAAKLVWPAVNERALARAFRELDSQTLTFEGCRIDIAGSRARAWCPGYARYVGRVGKTTHTEQRDWNFVLRKSDERWQIDSVRSQ